jgi:hypothetical protein
MPHKYKTGDRVAIKSFPFGTIGPAWDLRGTIRPRPRGKYAKYPPDWHAVHIDGDAGPLCLHENSIRPA